MGGETGEGDACGDENAVTNPSPRNQIGEDQPSRGAIAEQAGDAPIDIAWAFR